MTHEILLKEGALNCSPAGISLGDSGEGQQGRTRSNLSNDEQLSTVPSRS